VIKERKHLRKKKRIYCHLSTGEPDCDDDRRIVVVITST